MTPQDGPWVSTAHGASHRPGGGDEIRPADIGAVALDQFAASGADPTALASLEGRVAALEAALNAHTTKKAGMAHK